MRRAILLALSTVFVLTVAGVAFGAIPGTDGVIHGCYLNDGSLRVIDTEAGAKCRAGEIELFWNQTGPQGPEGEQGPQGPQGLQGPQGPAGEVVGYRGTPIPIGFEIPAESTSVGHITLPPGEFWVHARLNVSNPTAESVLVQCEFAVFPGVGIPYGWVRLSPNFDMGSVVWNNFVQNTEQRPRDLTCRTSSPSGTATASVVAGDITAIHVTSTRFLG